MSFPYEITDMDEESNNKLKKDFLGENRGWVTVGPKKFVKPSRYRDLGPVMYNFKVRPDDSWIVTFPRSGTTLTQEMVWLIRNDCDYEGAAKRILLERFPQIEHFTQITDELKAKVQEESRGDPMREVLASKLLLDTIPLLEATPGLRFVKSHVPLSLLPPNLLDTCKVIYICRNPKDVAVSFYHLGEFLRTLEYVGDFPTFWNYFENNKVWCAPYWEHLREGWEKRNHPNMLFLFYEDIVKDITGTIRKVAAHYNKKMTDEQVKQLAEYLHIDNFKNNPSVNLEPIIIAKTKSAKSGFVREGKIGGSKSYFTPELNARADKWIAENIATIPGFAFPA